MKKLILLALAVFTTSSTLMLTSSIAHSQDIRTNKADFDRQLQERNIDLAELDREIERNPRSAMAWANRGSATEENDPRGAFSDYSKAIELNPKVSGFYFVRAVLRWSSFNDRAGAIADCRQAARIDRQQGNTKGVQMASRFLRELGVNR
jgi:tetratricopeptide (TPR) repeat protein